MGTLLDVLKDPNRGEQLTITLEAAIKSLMMAKSISLNTNRFAKFPKTHYVNFNTPDLVAWASDESGVTGFIEHCAKFVVQDLKTLGINTVGSITARIIPKASEHTVEIAITH